MHLLRLPPETLTQVFDQIGPSFFQEDLRRLAVCKQWLHYALPVCYKCVSFSREKLRRLINSGVLEKPSALQDSLETLEFKLERNKTSVSASDTRADAQDPNLPTASASDEAVGDDPATRWNEMLDSGLRQLALVTQQSHRLRTLRMRAWGSPSLGPLDSSKILLSIPTIRSLLSVENLRVLVLDLSVGFLKVPGEQGDGCHHICPAIGALLHKLETLHLRMRSICPDALKPCGPSGSGSLSLSRVAINLSLIPNLPGITSAAHSKRCGSQGGGVVQLKADILEQAEVLANQMTSSKTVRILTHSLPQLEIQSLDVLTGRTMVLDDDTAWDGDGKLVVEDSESESELSDHEFATYVDE
ncbi:hypothetical protein C2857_001036 [Epichloe festucae Fl1]|uniref:F-box domain-containing protein n=1 Tax=Epichloe festucae (strain Fl1) TaxID=877507 RepID=A0A7U3Q1B7_EPIFF|nr:hypothetical protein C2857_001036 [Epichloe festucae Fl1]